MLHTTMEPHVSLSNLKFLKSADQNAATLQQAVLYRTVSSKVRERDE